MSKNSTLDLLENLLSHDQLFTKKKVIVSEKNGPSKETIDTIIAYANSVEAFTVIPNEVFLISLN
jgi:hypothetical protein